MIIKVCGMTQADNIRAVEQLGADLMGFIFYSKSPRCLCETPSYLPQQAGRVGVFVNETKENVRMQIHRYGLAYIQLHGHESPQYCRALLEEEKGCVQLIKAFSIANAQDLQEISAYDGLCSYYLFDTKSPQYGGSGQLFDWALLHHYHGSTPFLLSGGIGLDSIEALGTFSHPQWAGIDLNSRFESTPGMKDVELLSKFLHQLPSSFIKA